MKHNTEYNDAMDHARREFRKPDSLALEARCPYIWSSNMADAWWITCWSLYYWGIAPRALHKSRGHSWTVDLAAGGVHTVFVDTPDHRVGIRVKEKHTGRLAMKETGGLMLIPAKAGTCAVCATPHAPELGHNLFSVFYGVRFKMAHGRNPSWDDAVAHLAEDDRKAFTEAVKGSGCVWSSTATPIAEPYAMSDPFGELRKK